jgi:ferredoxin
MGHLHRLKSEYRALVRRLEAAQASLPEPTNELAWKGWQEILEILFPPEEAALAAKLPVRPATLGSIAKRVGLTPEETRRRLEPMCDRGVVMDLTDSRTGQVRYLLAPPVVGFVEFSMMRAKDGIPKKRMAEALEAYLQGDEAFAQEVFGAETVIGRALAHENALDDELPDVLDWERASALIDDAELRAVSLCYCRHVAEHLGKACEAPVESCMSLNAGAEFVVRRGFGRAIDRSEAKDILTRSREQGLVQIADNVLRQPIYLCNCCGCCCEQLRAISRYDLPAVNPSGFVPHVDEAKCKGCSRCARACPVGAISMRPTRGAAQRKTELRPEVLLTRCIGCGVCVAACRNHAATLRRGATRRHVPANGLERVVRMALERGHLPDLIFDEGESQSTRLFNRLTRALASLPPVDLALANTQLKSRFVSGLLGRLRSGGHSGRPRETRA